MGIPWDVDTEGLKEYMSKYGELEDCIVMKVKSYFSILCFFIYLYVQFVYDYLPY